MRLAFWLISVFLLLIGVVTAFSHVRLQVTVPLLLGSAFFIYAAMLQEGTIPETRLSDEERKAALSTIPAEGHGALLIFRWGHPSRLIGMNLSLNERFIAQLKGHRFTRVDIPEGHYELRAEFATRFANRNLPQVVSVSIERGQFTIVGIAVGLPEKWKWWRIGSKANWRDQIYINVAPESARNDTLQGLRQVAMVSASESLPTENA